MKLVFEGETLAEINAKVLSTAQEIATTLNKPKTVQEMYDQDRHLVSEKTSEIRDEVPQARPAMTFPVQPEPSLNRANGGAHTPTSPQVGSSGQAPTSIGSSVIGGGGQGSQQAGTATKTVHLSTSQRPESVPLSSGVDSRGLPWDSRIHSSNKEQSKDGIWRKRRGVEDATVVAVEAELRANMPSTYASPSVGTNQGPSQNTPQSTPPGTVPPFGSMTPQQYQQHVNPAPVAPMPTTEHRVALPEGVLSQSQPAFAPPVQPTQVLPPNTHTPQSFRTNLVTILNDLATAGKIDHAWIQGQRPQFGGKDVTQWHENEEQCNKLFDAFVQWQLINRF